MHKLKTNSECRHFFLTLYAPPFKDSHTAQINVWRYALRCRVETKKVFIFSNIHNKKGYRFDPVILSHCSRLQRVIRFEFCGVIQAWMHLKWVSFEQLLVSIDIFWCYYHDLVCLIAWCCCKWSTMDKSTEKLYLIIREMEVSSWKSNLSKTSRWLFGL